MLTTFLILIILFFIYNWSVAWIEYYNKLDKRLGNSIWKWSYDYPVIGKRDVSFLDDRNLVMIRRQKNRAITIMYLIVFLSFIVLMSFVSQILLKILN
jgi:hypothetical protein|tara:strand:- start:2300 stop:2593 length:294 start_codon:yes stop_codon:yes gene_type:complete